MVKTRFIYILFLFFTFGPFEHEALAASEPQGFVCQEFLEPVEPQVNALELFAGYIRVSSQREIYVRIQKPQTGRVKEAVLLVHGLLDSHKRFDGMLEGLLRNGHPVIRVDLYAFGKSLTNELYRNEGSLQFLGDLPYETNVQDLKDLVRWAVSEFRFGPLQAVGHSMGGGLLAALASDPSMSEYLQRVLLVSPYIYRLEQFHLENQLLWIESLLLASDPVKEALITSAIATVKGLRELNAMDLVPEFPSALPIDLVISEKDELVPLELQEQLAQALEQRNSRVYRLNAGHMVPSETPDALLDIIHQR